jgi:uncharacterized protein
VADGVALDLLLDDLDPYRDNHHVAAAPRLPESAVRRYRELFDEAWRLLVRHAPARAAELSAGLSTVVPLVDLGDGYARSATARDAVGSFGLSLPATAADLAVTLVHEFQHSKLSGLLDIVTLYDRPAPGLHYAPWRQDPRPLGGLLQGVYAFLGVADTWRALRAAPSLRDRAEQEYADVRAQVAAALPALSASPYLTPAGRRFVRPLADTLRAMTAEPLPEPVVARARVALARNRRAWLARNGPLPG